MAKNTTLILFRVKNMGILKDHSRQYRWKMLSGWSCPSKPLGIGLCVWSQIHFEPKCISSRKKSVPLKIWFHKYMHVSSSRRRHKATLTSACDVGDLATWRKSSCCESNPGVLKGTIQQWMVPPFNCPRGYQCASMCDLVFNSPMTQLEPFEPFCPNHIFICSL